RVRRNLAALADARVLLDFDERADAGTAADRAAIQIDEARMMNHHVVGEADVFSDRHRQNRQSFSRTSTRPLLPQSMRTSRSGRDRQPSRTNINRSISLLRSVMWEGSRSSSCLKSSRSAGHGFKRVVT